MSYALLKGWPPTDSRSAGVTPAARVSSALILPTELEPFAADEVFGFYLISSVLEPELVEDFTLAVLLSVSERVPPPPDFINSLMMSIGFSSGRSLRV